MKIQCEIFASIYPYKISEAEDLFCHKMLPNMNKCEHEWSYFSPILRVVAFKFIESLQFTSLHPPIFFNLLYTYVPLPLSDIIENTMENTIYSMVISSRGTVFYCPPGVPTHLDPYIGSRTQSRQDCILINIHFTI